jgi:uncharacterized protein (TIGR00730 family)
MPGHDPVPGPDPPLAYRNQEFLDTEDARPIRILAEYLHPMQAFRRRHVRDTIVFFGSARVQETGPLAHYYADARELARLVAEWSNEMRDSRQRMIVCTGGGPGIMEAANRGAAEAGGRTIGLNIGLPHEQRPNAWITPGLCFQFHYFFMRKLWFAHLARALVVFPGGFGTLDELFELLTLSQTRKLSREIQIILYGSSYWNELINFEALVRHGMIAKEDLELFDFADSPDQALQILKTSLAPAPESDGPAFAESTTPEHVGGSGVHGKRGAP